eukprot:m.289916 g.289916  ORF g.289916 m.289916 type:complete len:179 (-) comp15812_c1_seq1:194-730(-)
MFVFEQSKVFRHVCNIAVWIWKVSPWSLPIVAQCFWQSVPPPPIPFPQPLPQLLPCASLQLTSMYSPEIFASSKLGRIDGIPVFPPAATDDSLTLYLQQHRLERCILHQIPSFQGDLFRLCFLKDNRASCWLIQKMPWEGRWWVFALNQEFPSTTPENSQSASANVFHNIVLDIKSNK